MRYNEEIDANHRAKNIVLKALKNVHLDAWNGADSWNGRNLTTLSSSAIRTKQKLICHGPANISSQEQPEAE